jgi:hypothetical protein
MGKFTHSTKDKVDREYIRKRTFKFHFFSVIMRAAEVQLTVDHQLPALLYESYPIKIKIKNCENIDIHSAM